MSVTVGLLDFGKSGNLLNVKKALEVAGAQVRVVSDAAGLRSVDKVVLPGVGSFPEAMEALGGLVEVVREVATTKPCLGICLGMQLLSAVGYEFRETPGLGLAEGEVKRMEVKGKVPHLGWGTLQVIRETPLLSGIGEQDPFYFMHSYEVINYTDVVALSQYLGHRFVAAIQKGQLFGVQFHPEKSREAGIKILRNFLAL